MPSRFTSVPPSKQERHDAAWRLNPFDVIESQADDFIDQCRQLANMLVVRSDEPEPFWSDAAETVIAAFNAHVCASEPAKE